MDEAIKNQGLICSPGSDQSVRKEKVKSRRSTKKRVKYHAGENVLLDHVDMSSEVKCEPEESNRKSEMKSEKKDSFSCSYCNYKTSQRNHMEAHIRIHTGDKPFRCTQCSKTFTQKSNLKTHMTVHEEKPRRLFACDDCDYTTKWKTSLRIHVRQHTGEKPYKCSICGRCFTQSTHLNTHIKEGHMGLRPHTCKICNKRFKRLDHLETHMRWHRNERNYECKVCGKRFLNDSSLTTHERIHMGEAGKIYFCDQCPYRSVTKCALDVHRRIHTGERPFGCVHCGQTFTVSQGLRIHVRALHAGEQGKIFKCDHCDYSTATKQNLKHHIQNHHAGGPKIQPWYREIYCPIERCGRVYKSYSSWYTHARRFHKVTKPKTLLVKSCWTWKYRGDASVSRVKYPNKKTKPILKRKLTSDEMPSLLYGMTPHDGSEKMISSSSSIFTTFTKEIKTETAEFKKQVCNMGVRTEADLSQKMVKRDDLDHICDIRNNDLLDIESTLNDKFTNSDVDIEGSKDEILSEAPKISSVVKKHNSVEKSRKKKTKGKRVICRTYQKLDDATNRNSAVRKHGKGKRKNQKSTASEGQLHRKGVSEKYKFTKHANTKANTMPVSCIEQKLNPVVRIEKLRKNQTPVSVISSVKDEFKIKEKESAIRSMSQDSKNKCEVYIDFDLDKGCQLGEITDQVKQSAKINRCEGSLSCADAIENELVISMDNTGKFTEVKPLAEDQELLQNGCHPLSLRELIQQFSSTPASADIKCELSGL